jgi:hypothetical protein
LPDRILVGFVLLGKGSNVEARNPQAVDQSLDRMSLSVAGRTEQKDPTLPGNSVFGVNISRFEERTKIGFNFLLQRPLQDQRFESRILDCFEKILVLVPPAAEDKDLAANFCIPFATRKDESLGDLRRFGYYVMA